MSTANAKIGELRLESDRTRAALTSTIKELKDKVGETASEVKTIISPAHIKSEVRNYARDVGSGFVEALTKRVAENPLQALAAGAALGFPALKLLRVIPTPLLLIGAGFWLTTQNGRRVVESAADQASQTINGVQEAASEIVASAGDKASELADTGKAIISDAVDANVTPLFDKARRTLHDTRDTVSDFGQVVADKASAIADSSTTTAAKSSRSTQENVSNAGANLQSSVVDFANKNPLLTAALGIAAGAFIAAALPTSSAEQRALGGSSARAKRSGRQALNETIDKAANLAGQTLSSVTDAITREGLSPDAMRASADDIATRAKSVAEKGIDAAFSGIDEHKGENR